MKRRVFLAASAAVTAPLIAGCSGGGSENDGNQPTPGNGGVEQTTSVIVKNDEYDPMKAAIDPGQTMQWLSQETHEHTVTAAQFHDKAASWEFDEKLPAGGVISHTFEEAGVYEYYCTIHGEETMCGAVLVGDVTLEEPLPCEDG